MRAWLAMVSAVAIGTSANAAPFLIGLNGDWGASFLDMGSLQRNGSIVTGVEYGIPRAAEAPGAFRLTQHRWDCASKQDERLKTQWLDAGRKVVSEFGAVAPTTYAPGTLGANLLARACEVRSAARPVATFDEAVQRGRAWLAANPSHELKLATKPRWERLPTYKEIKRAYPAEARANGVKGEALVECVGRLDHTLSDCVTTMERPAAAGFGAAAVQLTRVMRLQPPVVDGKPVDGIVVKVPIRFVP